MAFTKTARLSVVLGISIAFFVVEISIGFKTGALALIADADIISYAIALVATRLALRTKGPAGYTYALRRSEILGAFFNATFLLALAVSIVLQSIERFINLPSVENPLWVLIVGCAGLALNICSLLIVQEHGHSHGPTNATATATATSTANDDGPLDMELRQLQAAPLNNLGGRAGVRVDQTPGDAPNNLGLAGVLIHLLGDAVNNIGVIMAAAIMWKLDSPSRFYADPAVSLAIGLIIFVGAIPLTLRSSRVLLEAAPKNLDLEEVRADLKTIPGVSSIHDFHIWHLTEADLLASFHVKTAVANLEAWSPVERELKACLAAYGVGHITIAPEFQQQQHQQQVQEQEGVKEGCADGGDTCT